MHITQLYIVLEYWAERETHVVSLHLISSVPMILYDTAIHTLQYTASVAVQSIQVRLAIIPSRYPFFRHGVDGIQ